MFMSRPAARQRRALGFSLAELLVVLGIIALLLALLMPALSKAKAQALEVACQAGLRDIGLAAEFHAQQHRGHLPAAGYQWDPTDGVVNPRGLDDPDARKYVYYEDSGETRPAPITVALAVSTGMPLRLESRETLEEDMESEVLRKRFRCPADTLLMEGVSQLAQDGWTTPPEYSGYVFNEALLGRRNHKSDPKWPAGKMTMVRRPSQVLFAMDGKPRDKVGDRMLAVYDNTPDDTLLDFARSELPSGNSGRDALDYFRHRFRANVLFLDWHVENIVLDENGLKGVGISKGIYD